VVVKHGEAQLRAWRRYDAKRQQDPAHRAKVRLRVAAHRARVRAQSCCPKAAQPLPPRCVLPPLAEDTGCQACVLLQRVTTTGGCTPPEPPPAGAAGGCECTVGAGVGEGEGGCECAAARGAPGA
jgi:hypothetical protein